MGKLIEADFTRNIDKSPQLIPGYNFAPISFDKASKKDLIRIATQIEIAYVLAEEALGNGRMLDKEFEQYENAWVGLIKYCGEEILDEIEYCAQEILSQ